MFQLALQTVVGGLSKGPEIKPGCVYRRTEPTFVETAYVLAVEPDRVGIPHVRFTSQLEAAHGHGAEFSGHRQLSLSIFRGSFSELN